MRKHIVVLLTIALVPCADDETSSSTTAAATISNPDGLDAHVASIAMSGPTPLWSSGTCCH